MSGSQGAWARVVVGPRMRIASADAGWLQLFRFSLGEVANKSLAICSGPKTKIKAIESMLESRAGPPTWVTLYDKSGSEVVLIVRASLTREENEDNLALEMQSVDSLSRSFERSEQQDAEAAASFSNDRHEESVDSLSLFELRKEQDREAEDAAASSDDTLSREGSFSASFSESFSSAITLEPAATTQKQQDEQEAATAASCRTTPVWTSREEPASFSSATTLEPAATIHKGGRAHLQSFLAAGRRRDLAGERGQGQLFSRARS
ncbi:hypothetical protein T484DRAFT_2563797 [Baffinella frigidus]|nr:hypothetical protein T484DRAFT_2563797 [Cryptophyta sp. CCMP2293]